MHNDLRKVRRIVEGSKSWETRRVRTLGPTDPKHGIGHRLSVRHWLGPTGRPHRTRVASSSVGLALLLLCAPAFAAQLECRVASVTRGDTLMCLTVDNRQELIRLRGIDAPGRKQPFGEHARQHLADLAHGKSATVHWTYRDHHGRIIGAVWVEPVGCPGCGHTLDVGRAQLASGMARWAQRYASQQPVEERYAYEFEESEARARRTGLWRKFKESSQTQASQ